MALEIDCQLHYAHAIRDVKSSNAATFFLFQIYIEGFGSIYLDFVIITARDEQWLLIVE